MKIRYADSEVHLGPFQTRMIKFFFSKNNNSLKLLAFSVKKI